jgi:hypothetical protein
MIKTGIVWLLRLLALRWLVQWLFPGTGLIDPCEHPDDLDECDLSAEDDVPEDTWSHPVFDDDALTDALQLTIASDELDLLF